MSVAYDQAGGGATGEAAANAVYEGSFVLTNSTIILGLNASNFNKLHELGHVNQAPEEPIEAMKDAAEAKDLPEKEYNESKSEQNCQ